MPRFDAKRFDELILYIAEQTADDSDFGHTKLAKALFYSDFDSYRRLGAAITGAKYENWEYGPYPPGLHAGVGRLEGQGRIRRVPQERKYDTYRFLPTQKGAPADLLAVGLTAAQIKIVDEWIQRIERASAATIKRLSHEFAGYKIVARNDAISYDSALLADRPPSDKDLADARRIAEKHGWLVGNEWQRS